MIRQLLDKSPGIAFILILLGLWVIMVTVAAIRDKVKNNEKS